MTNKDEKFAAANKLGNVICSYIEQCQTNLKLSDAVKAGVCIIIRQNVKRFTKEQ